MGRLPILIGLSLFLLAFDYYCYRAILAVFKNWTPKTKRLFKVLWWGYTITLVIGVFAAIYLNLYLTLRSIILVAFFLTVVCKFVMLPFLLIDDLRRAVIRISRLSKGDRPAPEVDGLRLKTAVQSAEPISRSAFLVKAGLITAAVPLSSLTWGIASGAYDYQIKRHKLVLPNLPAGFDGLTLAQISDIHSGSFYNRKAVLGGVEMLMAERPDMVFFTGDLINNLATELYDYQDIFSKVRAPLGVYSVLGNHDYGEYHFGKESSVAKAANLANVKRSHQLMGWDLLLNEHRKIKVGNDEIGVLGIENWGMGRFPRYGHMELAVAGTQDLPVKLLLSHDPSHWQGEVTQKYTDIDAMFSGHTHGMQFGVRTDDYQWSPVQYIYKEWAGLYRQEQQQLYVNVGYGFLGYPGRVGILPEITIFELKRA